MNLKKSFPILLCTFVSAMALSSSCGNASYDYPYQNPQLPLEERLDNLMSLLTLEEKLSLMIDQQPAIERIGLPSFELGGEACHGLRGDGVTVFPQAIAMAATFDAPQQQEIFSAVSDEARASRNAYGTTICFWCPNINIVRDPRWGRSQETYGEDPYLTGVMGSAVVRGLQGDDPKYLKAAACAKHFSVHSGPEPIRHRFAPAIYDRDLWETYMPAFKDLVTKADVSQVMCAYTKFDGKPCCGSDKLLTGILRNEWGFDGMVVSDCGAIADFFMQNHHETHSDGAAASAAAVLSGDNIECGELGGQNVYVHLSESLEQGLLGESDIDAALRPALRLRFELGDLDPAKMLPWHKLGPKTISSPEHNALALKAARESMVLLANDGTLPLSKDLKKILVVGPNADDTEMHLGNYNGQPVKETNISILEGIRRAVPGAEVSYVRGCGHAGIEGCSFIVGDEDNGLKCEYYDNTTFSGEPIHTSGAGYIVLNTSDGVETDLPEKFSVHYTGHIKNTSGHEMLYVLRSNGKYRFKVDGCLIAQQTESDQSIRWDSVPDMTESFFVEAGKDFDIDIEFVKDFDGPAHLYFDVASTYSLPEEEVNVGDADVVIAVTGLSSYLENEQLPAITDGFYGGDRTKIELPDVQQRLLARVHESGKPVVVVNCSGSAVSFSEVEDQYNALLQAWYGGQAMGTAVADVLFGDYNPAGRLPVTFYASTSQLPDFTDYNMEGRTYRYFHDKPEFPFGYGLSYTTFAYGEASLSSDSMSEGETVTVSIPVSNTGKRAGDEVVQVYVKCLDLPTAPIKSLRGFSRVNIKPGETADVEITLDRESFEFFDNALGKMAFHSGNYRILYGGSSADADLKSLDFKTL